MRRYPAAKGNPSSSVEMTVWAQLSADQGVQIHWVDTSALTFLRGSKNRESKQMLKLACWHEVEWQTGTSINGKDGAKAAIWLIKTTGEGEEDIWNIWPHGATQKRIFLFCHWLCKTPQQLYGPGKSQIKWLSLETRRGRWVLGRHLLSQSSQELPSTCCCRQWRQSQALLCMIWQQEQCICLGVGDLCSFLKQELKPEGRGSEGSFLSTWLANCKPGMSNHLEAKSCTGKYCKNKEAFGKGSEIWEKQKTYSKNYSEKPSNEEHSY